MRVALVGQHEAISDGQHSGAMSQLRGLAAALAARGLDVTVYTCHPCSDGPASTSTVMGYRVKSLPLELMSAKHRGDVRNGVGDAELSPVLGDFARGLNAAWSDERPDVAGADTWIYGVAAQLAADRLGVPTVQTLPILKAVAERRQQRQIGPSARTRFERLLAKSATRVIASCSEDVFDLIKLGCPRSKLSVLPRGVDVEAFSPVGEAVERRDGRRIVAMASDLLLHRGFDVLIAALPALPDAEVLIVGGPPRHLLGQDRDSARLLHVAADHGVAARVQLAGMVQHAHVPRILRSADVFACPSWYEPFGLPVVEAMACGLPVVASNVGGMMDTVIDAVTGVLVPPRNHRQLAAALEAVLNAGPLRGGMGAAGLTRARACYRWERVATEAQTIYERAIDSRTPNLTRTDKGAMA